MEYAQTSRLASARHPITPAEMPWRVAIGLPKSSPKYGSRQQARDAAIAAMQQWETSIRTRVPWFELAFVESDGDAPIQIEWKRRMLGDAAGRAGPVCRGEGDSLKAGGQMEIAVQGCPTCRPLTVDEIKALVAHEFGHILGLGHCLDCDSAMNYSWQTRDRVFVTQTDVTAAAFLLDEEKSGGTDAATIEHFVLEGHILAYDEARSLVQIRVTATEPERFVSLAIHSLQNGNPIPAGIDVGSKPWFRVTPTGTALQRTVIRLAVGTALDTKDTAEGFAQAMSELPRDKPGTFRLERRGAPEGGDPESEFQVSGILLPPAGKPPRED